MSNLRGTAQSVIISGVGAYTPDRIVTNDDLAKIMDTSDEWIRTRSGIGERRIVADGENCSHMAAAAGRTALEKAGLAPDAIDLVIVATITPDMPFPSTACLVQAELGLRQVPCFDLEAACSGFLYALEMARSYLLAGAGKHAMIIGAEKLSSILDWEDRATSVLFGDGAGAAILSLVDENDVGILGTIMGAKGSESGVLYMPGSGSNIPATEESVADRQHFLKMNGREVYKLAVKAMGQASRDICEQFSLTPDDLDCVIPHQANMRIIEAISSRLEVPMERFVINLDKYGNTSAASIPIALFEAIESGKINSGDNILLVAFGAGLTWASSLLKWH